MAKEPITQSGLGAALRALSPQEEGEDTQTEIKPGLGLIDRRSAQDLIKRFDCPAIDALGQYSVSAEVRLMRIARDLKVMEHSRGLFARTVEIRAEKPKFYHYGLAAPEDENFAPDLEELALILWGEKLSVSNLIGLMRMAVKGMPQVHLKLPNVTVGSIKLFSQVTAFEDGRVFVEIIDWQNGELILCPYTEEKTEVARPTAPGELDGSLKQKIIDLFTAAADPKELGALLKELRDEAEVSQAEIGRRMGVSRATVNKLELGAGNPTWKTLTAFVEAVREPAQM